MTNLRRMSVTISRWIACSAVALLLPTIGPASAEEICKERICTTSTDAPNPSGGWAVHVRLREVYGVWRDHHNVIAPGAEQFEMTLPGEFDFLVPPGGTTEYSVQGCYGGLIGSEDSCDPWETFNHPIVEPSGSASGSPFCQEYTDAAVSQAQESEQLGCGNDGPRWSTDPSGHLGWCLALGGDEALPSAEKAARAEGLNACRQAKASLEPKGADDTFKKMGKTPAQEPDEPAQPAGYRITCQGGGGMTAKSTNDGFLRILFAPAANGSQDVDPGHGECAWFDRGFRPNEPEMLVYSAGGKTAKDLARVATKGGLFQVHAYNNNQGAIVIVSVDEIKVVEAKAEPDHEKSANFSGTWNSITDKDWSYRITLKQKPNGQVGGSYVAQDGSTGTITGRVKGNVLTFKWSQETGDGTYVGSGQFRLAGDTFEGDYTTDEYPNPDTDPSLLSGAWSGERQ